MIYKTSTGTVVLLQQVNDRYGIVQYNGSGRIVTALMDRLEAGYGKDPLYASGMVKQHQGVFTVDHQDRLMYIDKYTTVDDIVVRYVASGNRVRSTMRQFRNASIQDLQPDTMGVGFRDGLSVGSTNVYKVWTSLVRSHSNSVTTLCLDWLHFGKFRHWYFRNYAPDSKLIVGLLDVDNHVHSNNNSCFIPGARTRIFDHVLDPSISPTSGVRPTKYGTYAGQILTDGHFEHLGTFSRPETAHAAWRAAKVSTILNYQELHENRLSAGLNEAIDRVLYRLRTT